MHPPDSWCCNSSDDIPVTASKFSIMVRLSISMAADLMDEDNVSTVIEILVMESTDPIVEDIMWRI